MSTNKPRLLSESEEDVIEMQDFGNETTQNIPMSGDISIGSENEGDDILLHSEFDTTAFGSGGNKKKPRTINETVEKGLDVINGILDVMDKKVNGNKREREKYAEIASLTDDQKANQIIKLQKTIERLRGTINQSDNASSQILIETHKDTIKKRKTNKRRSCGCIFILILIVVSLILFNLFQFMSVYLLNGGISDVRTCTVGEYEVFTGSRGCFPNKVVETLLDSVFHRYQHFNATV